MNSMTRFLALVALMLGLAVAPATFAQTLLAEDFTGTTELGLQRGRQLAVLQWRLPYCRRQHRTHLPGRQHPGLCRPY